MLEGYFALKRDVTVELLAACCEHASDRDLDRLLDACFALREEARWQEDGRRWGALEFELLRQAGDERILSRLAPTLEADGTPEAPGDVTQAPPVDTADDAPAERCLACSDSWI